MGFKWDVAGKILNLSLGFSHPVKMTIPEGLTVVAEKSTLVVSGFDKELVGQFTANVRAQKNQSRIKVKVSVMMARLYAANKVRRPHKLYEYY